ncbi:hypothetical protein [Nonomuraea guangzhouensis]|uniref:Uncharacterized protein n=1 Tax=Nonomuraea guangzhouensis TaxID=1291555 RepID=A0ABW4G6H4_9ACTN|nr:hypothetical protein [Nonomuraea guangzhouensis]
MSGFVRGKLLATLLGLSVVFSPLPVLGESSRTVLPAALPDHDRPPPASAKATAAATNATSGPAASPPPAPAIRPATLGGETPYGEGDWKPDKGT